MTFGYRKRSWLTYDLSGNVALIGLQTHCSRNQRAKCSRISYGTCFGLEYLNMTTHVQNVFRAMLRKISSLRLMGYRLDTLLAAW